MGEVSGKKILTTAELAEMIGWSTSRVRRLLKRNNAAFRTRASGGTGCHWYTTTARLRDALPDVYELIWHLLEAREQEESIDELDS